MFIKAPAIATHKEVAIRWQWLRLKICNCHAKGGQRKSRSRRRGLGCLRARSPGRHRRAESVARGSLRAIGFSLQGNPRKAECATSVLRTAETPTAFSRRHFRLWIQYSSAFADFSIHAGSCQSLPIFCLLSPARLPVPPPELWPKISMTGRLLPAGLHPLHSVHCGPYSRRLCASPASFFVRPSRKQSHSSGRIWKFPCANSGMRTAAIAAKRASSVPACISANIARSSRPGR